MTKPIRLIIADDEMLIRTGLKIMLEASGNVEVLALAENGRAAFEACTIHRPDVVLMDIRMPESNGIEGTKLIKEAFPEVKVLIVTTFQDTEYIVEAVQNGASGYLLKDSSPDAILDGIKVALSGKVVMDTVISEALLTNTSVEKEESFDAEKWGLTTREVELIAQVAKGLSNKEIAQTLFLSEGTVKNNISTILSKLELRDRTQLVIFAYENKLKQ
ncbi:response regulator transcription factor [Granulicatella adiacens ATCC 49175]|jgi:DNA-binding response regulator|uniref:Response regulator receiver domain protein n=1 Tax=Granulicatella adiacens ATCC 49175 TaxID=638301 RepID=C8NJ19_9LACT|nr:response regulator transcription factor [Granulicatella adiacens]EEW36354.1 response regulator receiver domain protein [Granulicatella adiacens ATCC 49175]UAK92881.1 response regulator transcription factor [Granulicatella adiacens]UWP38139.1 response regulator transcription factor [Granulicatella adiacens ATCC 49175]